MVFLIKQARNYTLIYVKYKNGIRALNDNRDKINPYNSHTEIERLQPELKLERTKHQKQK